MDIKCSFQNIWSKTGGFRSLWGKGQLEKAKKKLIIPPSSMAPVHRTLYAVWLQEFSHKLKVETLRGWLFPGVYDVTTHEQSSASELQSLLRVIRGTPGVAYKAGPCVMWTGSLNLCPRTLSSPSCGQGLISISLMNRLLTKLESEWVYKLGGSN